jgi:hypothetical protein
VSENERSNIFGLVHYLGYTIISTYGVDCYETVIALSCLLSYVNAGVLKNTAMESRAIGCIVGKLLKAICQ